jgi:hypothetical protein
LIAGGEEADVTDDKRTTRKDEQWTSEDDTVEKRDREGLPATEQEEEGRRHATGVGSRESEAARGAGGQAEGRRAKRV